MGEEEKGDEGIAEGFSEERGTRKEVLGSSVNMVSPARCALPTSSYCEWPISRAWSRRADGGY